MQIRYMVGLDFLALVAIASGHVVCAGEGHQGGLAAGLASVSRLSPYAPYVITPRRPVFNLPVQEPREGVTDLAKRPLNETPRTTTLATPSARYGLPSGLNPHRTA